MNTSNTYFLANHFNFINFNEYQIKFGIFHQLENFGRWIFASVNIFKMFLLKLLTVYNNLNKNFNKRTDLIECNISKLS